MARGLDRLDAESAALERSGLDDSVDAEPVRPCHSPLGSCGNELLLRRTACNARCGRSARDDDRLRDEADPARVVEIAVRQEQVDRALTLARARDEMLDLIRCVARVAKERIGSRAREERVRLPERRLRDPQTFGEFLEPAHGRRR